MSGHVTDSDVVLAMREMLADGKDLTAEGKPEAPALGSKLGAKISAKQRDRLFDKLCKEDQMAEKSKAAKKPAPKPAGAGFGDLTLHQQETLVQISAEACRRLGQREPSPGVIRQMAGCDFGTFPEVTNEQIGAALAEAKQRSETLDHGEIVSKARWP